MFLTDVLFSSPRLRFSEAQMTAVLAWGKDLGAREVPSLGGLKRCRKAIGDLLGNPTKKFTSASGNIFYLNDIGKAIARVIVQSSLRAVVLTLTFLRITQIQLLDLPCKTILRIATAG